LRLFLFDLIVIEVFEVESLLLYLLQAFANA